MSDPVIRVPVEPGVGRILIEVTVDQEAHSDGSGIFVQEARVIMSTLDQTALHELAHSAVDQFDGENQMFSAIRDYGIETS